MLPVGGGGKRSCRIPVVAAVLLGFSGSVFTRLENRSLSLVRPHVSCGPRAAFVVGMSPASFRGGLPKAFDGLNEVELPPAEPKSKRATIPQGAARSFVQTARPIARSGESHHQSQPPRNIVVFWRSLRVCCTQETPLLTERLNKSERRSHARSPILAATRST